MVLLTTLLIASASTILNAAAAPLSSRQAGAVNCTKGGALMAQGDVNAIIQDFCDVFKEETSGEGPDTAGVTYEINGRSVYIGLNVTDSGPYSMDPYRCIDVFTSVQIQCATAQSGSVIINAPDAAFFLTINPSTTPEITSTDLEPKGLTLTSRTIKTARAGADGMHCAPLGGEGVAWTDAHNSYTSFCAAMGAYTIVPWSSLSIEYNVSTGVVSVKIETQEGPYSMPPSWCISMFDALLTDCAQSYPNWVWGGDYILNGVEFVLDVNNDVVSKRDESKVKLDNSMASDISRRHTLGGISTCASQGENALSVDQAWNAYQDFCARTNNLLLGVESINGEEYDYRGGKVVVVAVNYGDDPWLIDLNSCSAAFDNLITECSTNPDLVWGGSYTYGDGSKNFIFDVNNGVNLPRGVDSLPIPAKRNLAAGLHCAQGVATGVDYNSANDAYNTYCAVLDNYRILVGSSYGLEFDLTDGKIFMNIIPPPFTELVVTVDWCNHAFSEILNDCPNPQGNTIYGGTNVLAEDGVEFIFAVNDNFTPEKRDVSGDLVVAAPNKPVEHATAKRKLPEGASCAALNGAYSAPVADAITAYKEFCAKAAGQTIEAYKWLSGDQQLAQYGPMYEEAIFPAPGQSLKVDHADCLATFHSILEECKDPSGTTIMGGTWFYGPGKREYRLGVNLNSVPSKLETTSTTAETNSNEQRDISLITGVGKESLDTASSHTQVLRQDPFGTTRCYNSNFGAQPDEIQPMINDFCSKHGNTHIRGEVTVQEAYATGGSTAPSWVAVSNGKQMGDYYYLAESECFTIFDGLLQGCDMPQSGNDNKPGGTYTLFEGLVEFVLNINPAVPS
ncbi:hypothetical protein LTR62_005548 [Meristemomyces frigidus]|uniref:Uncharacterized protein n=1 Tax=Meristemomyces frigidus TaxID=1508187 RepID=A0AAN7YF86_9PEZI|nr:hypothetical protein LTR62_005548 [Meristemomyces frigidus]